MEHMQYMDNAKTLICRNIDLWLIIKNQTDDKNVLNRVWFGVNDKLKNINTEILHPIWKTLDGEYEIG